jgi:hypothetical protein
VPAADAETIRVGVPVDESGELTFQSFLVPVGATQQTVTVDVSPQFVLGRSVSVTLLHGTVVLASSGTGPLRDTCTAIAVDSWAVDQGVAPRD